MTNSNQIPIAKTPSSKTYDLEERTFQFVKGVALLVRKLPKTISNMQYAAQVIRASASVGSNYREANEALSKKDFLMRAKISRKEAKESVYWLRLIAETNDGTQEREVTDLMNEASELKKILSSIISKSE